MKCDRAQHESRNAFGAYLRELRQKRSLSLRDVSRLTREVSGDFSGRISHDYISKIEKGRPVVTPALPKLLSLAAVYGVNPDDLLLVLPEPLRSRRRAEFARWLADGHALPDPLVRVPQRRDRTDAELDVLFAKRSRGFAPDWQWKEACEREARGFLPFAVLPPFVESSLGLLDDFWRIHARKDWPRSWVSDGGALALVPLSPWLKITDLFVSWAVRETEAIVSALGLVSWWTLDFTTSAAACHFAAPDSEAKYAFDGIPPTIVAAVRRWQLARFLSEHGAPANVPPPPQPVEGAREFLHYLLQPRPFLPDAGPDAPPPAPVIYTSLSRILSAVPALRAADDQVNSGFVAAVASLLNRAAHTPQPGTRRPPASKPPAKRPKR